MKQTAALRGDPSKPHRASSVMERVILWDVSNQFFNRFNLLPFLSHLCVVQDHGDDRIRRRTSVHSWILNAFQRQNVDSDVIGKELGVVWTGRRRAYFIIVQLTGRTGC